MDNNKEDKEITEREKREKISKERDKMAVDKQTKAYLNISIEQEKNNKKEGLKRGWQIYA